MLKVDGSFIKPLQEEFMELYYTLEKKYNKKDLKLHSFYLVSYGIISKGFQLNFCLKHKAIKHGKTVEYYTQDRRHYFGTITEKGILTDLELEGLQKYLNTIKNYNAKSVLSKFKKVNDHIAKIEETEKGLPYYLRYTVKLDQSF